jgi:hypothetical protein
VEESQDANLQASVTETAAALEQEVHTPSSAENEVNEKEETIAVGSAACAMMPEEDAQENLLAVQETPTEVATEQEADLEVKDTVPSEEERVASPAVASETSELTVEPVEEEEEASKPTEDEAPAADTDPLTQSVPPLPTKSCGGEKKEEESFFTCFSAFKFW